MFENLKHWIIKKLGAVPAHQTSATAVAEGYASSSYKELLYKQEHQIAALQAKIDAYEAQQDNDVLADIHQLFVKQTEKGIRKYGETVKVENLSAVEWCQHALEECADNMVYMASLKKKLERGEF